MVLELKLRKVGNSVGVALPKECSASIATFSALSGVSAVIWLEGINDLGPHGEASLTELEQAITSGVRMFRSGGAGHQDHRRDPHAGAGAVQNSGQEMLFHNCADFSRAVLNIYLPDAIHRSVVADVGIATQKQVAALSWCSLARSTPRQEMSAFVIAQVPGTIKRSKPVDGVAQSLVKSKKYLIPMTILAPELTGGLVVAYMAEGRMELPKNAHGLQRGQ